MAYDEGQRRKKMIKKHQVQKFTQLSAVEKVRPMMVVVDEATSLLQAEPIPKGLPRKTPRCSSRSVSGTYCRATALNLMSQDPP